MIHLRRFTLLAFLMLLGAWQVQAQLVVQSITPSHGSTQVAQTLDIDIVFSQPLDQTGDKLFEDTGAAVNWQLYPSDFGTDFYFQQISNDGLTFTIANLSLKPNTQYTLVVEGAYGADGSMLARPAVATFTTGDSLPSGSISGTVSGSNLDLSRSLINVYTVAPFNENFYAGFAVADNSGNFTVDYLPAGKYYVIGMYDLNQNGQFLPDDGDLIGGYDPDKNKLVDPVNLSAGQNATGVNFPFQDATLQTARQVYQVVSPFVQPPGQGGSAAGADPALISILGPGLQKDGRAYVWGYLFYSSSADTSFGFFASQSLVVPAVPFAGDTSVPFLDTLKTPLPDNWMDSDAAMSKVNQAGGNDYFQNFPNARGVGFAATFNPDSLFLFNGGDNGNSLQKPAVRTPNRPRRFANWQTGLVPQTQLSPAGRGPNWLFVFDDPDAEEILSIFIAAVDMISGNATILSPTYGLARDNLQAAVAAGKQAVSDAKLVGISAPPFFAAMRPDGKAIFWSYIFYSASADSFFQLLMSNNRIFGSAPVDSFASKTPLPDTFLNSDVVIAKAEQRGGATFRQNNPGAFIIANLGYGLYPQDPTKLVWVIQYGTYFMPEEQWLTFIFNAENGDVLVNVEEIADNLPAEFQLQPVYPNPQRIGGSIHIPLTLREPANVEIALYNILGQVVQTVNYGRMPAGTQTLQMQSLLKNLSAGIYFVQVKFTRQNGQVHRLVQRLIVR